MSLLRKPAPEAPEQIRCSRGYIPRLNQPARRPGDCPHKCGFPAFCDSVPHYKDTNGEAS